MRIRLSDLRELCLKCLISVLSILAKPGAHEASCAIPRRLLPLALHRRGRPCQQLFHWRECAHLPLAHPRRLLPPPLTNPVYPPRLQRSTRRLYYHRSRSDHLLFFGVSAFGMFDPFRSMTPALSSLTDLQAFSSPTPFPPSSTSPSTSSLAPTPPSLAHRRRLIRLANFKNRSMLHQAHAKVLDRAHAKLHLVPIITVPTVLTVANLYFTGANSNPCGL